MEGFKKRWGRYGETRWLRK